MRDIMDLLGRVFLSTIFLYEGLDSFFYYKETKSQMIDFGMTWQPDFLLTSSIILLMLGGILVLIGYRSRFGAVLLLLYWVPLTLVLYSFWDDPSDIRRANSILFMKNIAITGGLLMIFVNGSGKYSIKRLFATTKVPQRRW